MNSQPFPHTSQSYVLKVGEILSTQGFGEGGGVRHLLEGDHPSVPAQFLTQDSHLWMDLLKLTCYQALGREFEPMHFCTWHTTCCYVFLPLVGLEALLHTQNWGFPWSLHIVFLCVFPFWFSGNVCYLKKNPVSLCGPKGNKRKEIWVQPKQGGVLLQIQNPLTLFWVWSKG